MGSSEAGNGAAAVAGAIATPSLLWRTRDRLLGRVREKRATRERRAAQRFGDVVGVARVRAVNAKRLKSAAKRTLSPVPHALLAPFASPHADVGLMCLSATVILSCFILRRDALVGPYAKFLDRRGRQDRRALRRAGALARAAHRRGIPGT